MVSTNDVQKLFLQAVASRRILSKQVAAKIWLKCVEAVQAVDDTLEIEYRENKWDEWVNRLNAALEPLAIEFAHVFDEATGKDMYALVNRKSDEIAQLASDYTAGEIMYFRAILEQIMLAPNESYCVSSLAALREVNHVQTTMTKSQAQHVLGSFVARGWLLKSTKGRYSLSTRTILELQPYLRSTYPDEVLECTICFEMVTSGYACFTPACKLRLHNHCYKNHRRMRSDCPTCKVEWSEGDSKLLRVGEQAFKDGQEKGRRVRSVGADEDEDDEEDEDQSQSQSREPSEPSQTQTKVKKEKTTKSKGKGKKKVVESDEDEEMGEDGETPPPRTQGKRKARS